MESIARVRDLKVMPASFAAIITTTACRLQAYVLWISMFRHVDFVQAYRLSVLDHNTYACTKSTCLNIEIVDFDLQAGGFRTVNGFRGFRFLAEVTFEWISWISIIRHGFRFLGSGFRTFCGFHGFRGFRLLGRPST